MTLALDVRMARSRLKTRPRVRRPVPRPPRRRSSSQASAELRELARGIHPAVLTDRGLAPAIEALAARAPVPVEVVALPAERLPPWRGDRVLHGLRGADERGQVRAGDARDGPAGQRGRRARHRGPRRRHRRRQGRHRLGAERPRRPRRRAATARSASPARRARARSCAPCCRSTAEVSRPAPPPLRGVIYPRRIGCCDHTRRWRPSSALPPRLFASTAGPAAAADDARGKQIEAGIEAYQRAYPKISLENATLAAKQQDERKELYGVLSKGGEQTFGGASFDPVSGVLKVFATNREVAEVAGETGQAARPQRRDADRRAQLRRPRAPGQGDPRPQGHARLVRPLLRRHRDREQPLRHRRHPGAGEARRGGGQRRPA